MTEPANTTDTPAGAGWDWLTPGRFALLLAALIAAAFPAVLFGGESFFRSDYGVLAYPAVSYFRECFWRGELPLWNPLSNCGAPFLAQWGTMVLYPGSLIYLLLPLPWSLGFCSLLHLWLGGFGMFKLAERWTGHRLAAAVAGVAFVFNGVTLACLVWPNYPVALGWMPWVVLLTERAWREGGRAIVLAALAGAMQMLSGAPELVLFTWLAVGALAVLEVQSSKFKVQSCQASPNSEPQFPLTPALSPGERENRSQMGEQSERVGSAQKQGAALPLPAGEGRGEGERGAGVPLSSALKPAPQDSTGERPCLRSVLGRLAFVILLVAGLCAAQLLPFFELLAHSQRDASFATAKWSLPAWGWANLLVPLFRCAMTPQGFYFQQGQEFLTSTYLGAATLALAFLAVLRVRERRVWLLAALTLFALVMALGENSFVYRGLKALIPVAGMARYPVKFLLLAAFTVPLLAAFGVRWCVGQASRLSPASMPLDRQPVEQSGLARPTPSGGEGRSETGATPVLLRDAASNDPSADARVEPALATWRPLFLAGGAVALLALVLAWTARAYPLSIYDRAAEVGGNTFSRLLFLAATVGALLAAVRAVKFETRLGGVLAALGLLAWDASTHLPRQNPTIPATLLTAGAAREATQLNPPPRHGESRVMISPAAEQKLLMSEVADWGRDFGGKRLAFWSHLNLLDGVPKVNGSSTLQVREQAAVQKLIYTNPTALGELLDFLGVAHVTAPEQVTQWTNRTTWMPLATAGQQPEFVSWGQALFSITEPKFDPREFVCLPNEARTAAQATNRTVAKITAARYTAQRIELDVSAEAAAWVVVAQSWYPAWRAFVDGRPVPLWHANFAFQALETPPGNHRVTLVYRDARFLLGAAISILTLLGCLRLWRQGCSKEVTK